MKIDHVGLFVLDLPRTVAFYQLYFAAVASAEYVNPKTSFRSRFLTFADGARLEVCTRTDLNPTRLDGFPVGYAHLAFALGSEAAVSDLTARLVAAGYPKLSGPRVTGDGYFESVVADPEGNQLELTV